MACNSITSTGVVTFIELSIKNVPTIEHDVEHMSVFAIGGGLSSTSKESKSFALTQAKTRWLYSLSQG